MPTEIKVKDSAAVLRYFDGQRFGKAQILFVGLIAFGFFFEQYDIFNFGLTAPAITKFWGLSMSWVGNTNALGQIGMTAGALVGGWFSDRIGRKRAFLTATLLYGVSTIVCGMAPNPTFFVAIRLLAMFGTVALAVITMVYIAEMLPADKRGKWELRVVGIGLLSLPIGSLFARWVVAMGPAGWRWVYYCGGGFAAIEALLVFLWCNESPRWLVSKGRGAEAKAILERMLPHANFDPSVVAAAIQQRHETTKINVLKALKDMWSPFYRRRSALLFVLAIIGSNTIGTFVVMIPTFFRAQGLSMSDTLLLVSVMSWGAPIGVLLASVSLDKGGRKIPVALFGILTAAMIVTVAFTKGFVPLAIVGVVLYMALYMYYWGSNVYTAESYGTDIRNTATGTIVATGRIVTAIWFAYIAAMFKALKFSGFFALMAGILFVTMIALLVFGHRTAGKSLEVIAGE